MTYLLDWFGREWGNSFEENPVLNFTAFKGFRCVRRPGLAVAVWVMLPLIQIHLSRATEIHSATLSSELTQAIPSRDRSPSPSIHFERGFKEFIKRDYAKAIHHFEAWVNAEPRNPDALCWLAKALSYHCNNRYQAGESRLSMADEGKRIGRLYEQALEIDPNHPKALLGHAIFLRSIPSVFGGNHQKSRTIFEQLLERTPNDPFVLHAYAIQLEEDNEPERAIEILRKIVETPNIGMRDPELKLKLSQCYFHLGRMLWEYNKDAETARRYLTIDVEKWPFMVEAYLLLAEIAVANNERATAVGWYLRALDSAETYQDKRSANAAERGLKKLKVHPEEYQMLVPPEYVQSSNKPIYRGAEASGDSDPSESTE